MRRRLPALALTVIAAMVPLAGCGDDDESNGGDSSSGSGSVYGGSSSGSEDAAAENESGAAEDDSGAAEENAGAVEATESGAVEIVEFAYDPVDVTVSSGGTIEWTNSDSAPHTATAEDDSFDTGSLDQGDSAKITFDEPGTFEYICTFHPFMNATVKVVE